MIQSMSLVEAFGAAPQMLAAISNAVLNLLRMDGWQNIAAAIRHHSVKVHKALKLLGILKTKNLCYLVKQTHGTHTVSRGPFLAK